MDRDLLIFERGESGRRCATFPDAGDPAVPIPDEMHRKDAPALPEVSELELVRHYVNLSSMNFSIDTAFYPLGSCTMKYNPKVHERAARLPDFAGLPTPSLMQLPPRRRYAFLWEMDGNIGRRNGNGRLYVSAGGRSAGVNSSASLLNRGVPPREAGIPRQIVLIPDSAHGTNPATAAMFAAFRWRR